MMLLIRITRLFIAIVLGSACIGKFTAWHNFEGAVGNFGIPRPLIGVTAVLIVSAETLTSALLVFSRTTSIGAASGIMLFLVFSIAIALNLLFGRHPECSCFGSIRSMPITWRSSFRSLGFAILSTVVFEARNAVSLSDDRQALVALAIGFVSIIFSLQIFRISFLVHRRVGVEVTVPTQYSCALPIGTPAPPFEVRTEDGKLCDFKEMIERQAPILFLFIAARCSACSRVLSDLSEWRNRQLKPVSVLIVGRGDPAGIRGMAIAGGFTSFVIQRDREIAAAYGISATPSAVLIDERGRIGTHLALGPIGINDLLRRISSTEITRGTSVSSGPCAEDAAP